MTLKGMPYLFRALYFERLSLFRSRSRQDISMVDAPDLPSSSGIQSPRYRLKPPDPSTAQKPPTQLHLLCTCSNIYAMPGKAQVARVAIDDEGWLAFRQVALTQGVSVSAYLGRLVERELGRRRGRAEAGVAPPPL